MKNIDKATLIAAILLGTSTAFAGAPTPVTASGQALSATTAGNNYSMANTVCTFLQNPIEFGLSANVGGSIACASAAGMAVGTVSYKGQGKSYTLTTAGGNSIIEANIAKPADLAGAGSAAANAAVAADSGASY